MIHQERIVHSVGRLERVVTCSWGVCPRNASDFSNPPEKRCFVFVFWVEFMLAKFTIAIAGWQMDPDWVHGFPLKMGISWKTRLLLTSIKIIHNVFAPVFFWWSNRLNRPTMVVKDCFIEASAVPNRKNGVKSVMDLLGGWRLQLAGWKTTKVCV